MKRLMIMLEAKRHKDIDRYRPCKLNHRVRLGLAAVTTLTAR